MGIPNEAKFLILFGLFQNYKKSILDSSGTIQMKYQNQFPIRLFHKSNHLWHNPIEGFHCFSLGLDQYFINLFH